MAEGRLRFGTQSSADVKLFLTGPGEEKYGGNPVYLHSHILKRLKGFEGRFSNRWSSDKSSEMWVTTCHNFDHYLKCIVIMYGEHLDFPSIEECLGILSVASEMVAEESINKCMQYLEAVRWSAEEESQIRKVLSSEGLKLKILPDLAARLNRDDDDGHIVFVEKIIQEMVSVIKRGESRSSQNFETVEKDLRGILDGNASRDFVDASGRVLLQEFQSLVDCRDMLTLLRIFKHIQHCNGKILEAALKAFCEDAEFIEHVKEKSWNRNFYPPVFDIIMGFMKVIGEGKLVVSRASRVSLLTTWLPIMGSFNWCSSVEHKYHKYEELDKAVVNVVETLPPVDKKRICVIWAEVYGENAIDITMPLNVSKSL